MSAITYSPTAMPVPARTRPSAPARQQAAAPAAAPAAARAGWLERLALWAEAQPVHHRLGSWTVMGR